MGVDAQRRAGDEGDQVPAGLGAQLLGLLGLDDLGLDHAVGEHLAEDLDDEGVPRLDAVEIGEHDGVGQAPVPGDHGAGARAAHRQGGALQVSQALQEGLVGGAVVDGQVEVDGGDLEARHEAGAVDVEDLVVAQGLLPRLARAGGHVRIGLQDRADRQGVVVGAGIGQLRGGVGAGAVHGRGVVGHDPGLVVLADPTGDRRVGEDDHPRQRQRRGDEGGARQAPAPGAGGADGADGGTTAGV